MANADRIPSRPPMGEEIESGVGSAPQIVAKRQEEDGTYISVTKGGRVFRDVHIALDYDSRRDPRDARQLDSLLPKDVQADFKRRGIR